MSPTFELTSQLIGRRSAAFVVAAEEFVAEHPAHAGSIALLPADLAPLKDTYRRTLEQLLRVPPPV
jgi:hypothetical protein